MSIKRFLLASFLAWPATMSMVAADAPELSNERSQGALLNTSVPFIENQGQHPPEVQFYAETFTGTFFVMRDGGMWLAVPSKDNINNRAQVIEQTLVAQKASLPRGLRKSNTQVHLSLGPDARKWRSNVPAFDVVTMGEVYDGIELRLAARSRNVEQLYFVHAEADPAHIRMRVEGAKAVTGKDGNLDLHTAAGNLSLSKPVAYQDIDGVRHSVEVAYVVTQDGYGFSVGPYDRSKELIIDPLLDATYLGGSGSEAVLDMVVHPTNGHVYVAGRTNSASFGSQDEILDDTQAYVARLSSDLTELLAIHFMGGAGVETAQRIAIFPEGSLQAGKLVVAGSTDSTDWPDFGFGPQGGDSLFIGSFDVNLQAPLLRWVSGARQDRFGDLAIHPTNFQIYLAGETNSTDFPGMIASQPGSPGSFQPANAGIFDAFVARFGPNLQELLRATYLGGSAGSEVTVSILLAEGAVYVKGRTNSVDDWVFETAPQPNLGGGIEDLFAAKLNEALTGATMVTFLGGNGVEETKNSRIVVTSSGVYISGVTSSDGPGTTGIVWTPGAFVVRYDSDLGRGSAEPYIILTAGLKDILGHSEGNLYMLGTAGEGSNLPATGGTVQEDWKGGSDAFVTCFNADLVLQRSTYLGGSGSDTPVDFVESPSSGDLYVLGRTDSFDFPRAVGGARPNNAGPIDAFVARLTPDLSTPADSLSTYFGGAMDEQPVAIAVDADSGDVLIAGNTFSPDLPRTGGRAQATLITEPDGFVARFDATLAGVGGLSDIEVIPTELMFPDTAVGNGFELGLGISNLGEGDLVITEISNSNPTDFGVVISGGNATCSATSPFTLEFEESCVVSVTYLPQNESEHTGTVTIKSNDPDQGEVTVPLSGMGLPQGSESSGCSCSIPGQSRPVVPSALLLVLGVLSWLWVRSRRSI